jgi:4-hydroxy-tetrahydrodipicolinate reductase
MRILILGRGKTGRVVAEIARERGHSVQVLDKKENENAGSLTPPALASFEVVIDFTTPEAVVSNLRACLAAGAKVVVGTTGWYSHLDDMRALAARKDAALLYSTNFSFGVQLLFQLARFAGDRAAGYRYHIDETHHVEKHDAPSGTALALQKVLAGSKYGGSVSIDSHRIADAVGTHRLEISSDDESLVLEHQAFSRRSFAIGAVRGAEWLATQIGTYDFQDVFSQILA